MNTMFSYSKLLRLFYIVHMFTSLRLEVVWRTEQVIFYYIHKSNERGRQLFVIVMPRGFQVGDRVHLERDCIIFPSPPFGTAFGFVLAAPCFNNSVLDSTRYGLSVVPS